MNGYTFKYFNDNNIVSIYLNNELVGTCIKSIMNHDFYVGYLNEANYSENVYMKDIEDLKKYLVYVHIGITVSNNVSTKEKN